MSWDTENFTRKSQSREDHISGDENSTLKAIDSGKAGRVWGALHSLGEIAAMVG